ncbi:hypothetical protein KFL_003890090 [Klebsormidium nitens]|uniref:Uncharacterized protein n=1 Tax=Klebsormidium nitens TaxID=105231 RepID=A0A1Y1IIF5_KLENI|nr:hypothetical protein KFL_003890090 [Klebsormidium nitens]|eukprot:GAQ87938.1 hypothetical protein KFL_003890090 [Klebsormidium nitens]
MAVNYAGCIPSELLEKIVVMVLVSEEPKDASPGLIDPPVPVAEQESMQLAEQSAASMALVCKDWKEAMHSVGWNALLSKRLKGSVPCVPADALWLLRLLRAHAGDSMNVTEARAYLRVTSRDLHAYREAQGFPNVVGFRYDLALLVEVAAGKHGGVSGLRAYISRLEVRAAAAARAAQLREEARQREVDNILKSFDSRVSKYVNTFDYVTLGLGKSDEIIGQAAAIQKDLKTADEMARSAHVDLREDDLCGVSLGLFLKRQKSTVELACVFMRRMEVDVIGIPYKSTTDRSLVRQYVERGGDIASLIRSTGYPGHRAAARDVPVPRTKARTRGPNVEADGGGGSPLPALCGALINMPGDQRDVRTKTSRKTLQERAQLPAWS